MLLFFIIPTGKAIANITVYKRLFSYIVIADNSDADNSKLLPESGNIKYIFNGKNLEIARVLNLGIQAAAGQNYKYILTLNQDSFITESALRLLLKTVEEKKSEKWGIINA